MKQAFIALQIEGYDSTCTFMNRHILNKNAKNFLFSKHKVVLETLNFPTKIIILLQMFERFALTSPKNTLVDTL